MKSKSVVKSTYHYEFGKVFSRLIQMKDFSFESGLRGQIGIKRRVTQILELGKICFALLVQ